MVFGTDDKQSVCQIKNIDKIISLRDEKAVGYEFAVRSLLSEIILYLFTLQCHVQKTATEMDRRNESRFRDMLNLIEKNMMKTSRLKKLQMRHL